MTDDTSNGAARLFAYMDEKAAGPTGELAKVAGFAVSHRGGGCFAWGKKLEGGDELLICTDGNDIDAAPDDPVWLVGRHSEECGFVEIQAPMTFREALDAAGRLPSPVVGGEHEQERFDSVQAAIGWRTTKDSADGQA